MIQANNNWLIYGAVLLAISAAVMFARSIYLKRKMAQYHPLKYTSRYYPRAQWKHFEFKVTGSDIKVYKDGKEIEYIEHIEIDCDGMRIERGVIDTRKQRSKKQ